MIVRGNHDQLLEVFENLLDNAVTYTDDGKVVSVSVKQDTNYQVVEITDEFTYLSKLSEYKSVLKEKSEEL